MKLIWFFLWTLTHVFYRPVDSGATQLNENNIKEIMDNHELVVLNFYADWCRFSNILAPIFDEAADKIHASHRGRVAFGKIDCDKEADLCHNHSEGSLGQVFHVTKYPTIKYVRGGTVDKREYRGKRSVDAFENFVNEQLKEHVTEIATLADVNNKDTKKRHLIGYFDHKESADYQNFRKLGLVLKDDCEFSAGFGEVVGEKRPQGKNLVVFRPDEAHLNDPEEPYQGDISNYDDFLKWAKSKCIPLVRVITFENAEELTEEGLPFMLLFHRPDDTQSINEYTEAIKSQLADDKEKVNFLLADGQKFAHPLHHLGKSEKDLPLIAIDSFRHMYLFEDYRNIRVPGKLKQFVQDLYSGKLHREFHYGKDEPQVQDDGSSDGGGSDQNPSSEEQDPSPEGNERKARPATESTPPPSQFQHLGPSKNRYTILHDEF